MKNHHLRQALTIGLLSLCTAAPLSAWAKNKSAPEPLQCEIDGRMQACENQATNQDKPQKAKAFKAQASDGEDLTDKPQKKTKKKSKKAKKKAKAKAKVAE